MICSSLLRQPPPPPVEANVKYFSQKDPIYFNPKNGRILERFTDENGVLRYRERSDGTTLTIGDVYYNVYTMKTYKVAYSQGVYEYLI